MINLNITLLIQLGILLTLMLLLNQFLFKPMVQLLDERKRRTEGRRKAASQAEAEADAVWADYQKKIQDAKIEADRVRAELVRQGEGERHRIVALASGQAEKTVAEVRARVKGEAQEARKAFEAEAQSLAGSIAESILGRSA